MAVICCPPNPLVTLAVDEAGTTTDSHFIGAAFGTPEPDAWRERFEDAISWYPYSLHFHKLPPKRDGRYLATKAVINLLRTHRDWYGHFLHIDRSLVDPERFGNKANTEFNFWMAMLIRHRTKRPGRCYEVVLAERERRRGDLYLSSMLQEHLDIRQWKGGTHVELRSELARRDRLLQVADLIGSATRQLHVPSTNPLKLEIAAEVADLVRPPGGLLRPHQRIYQWHWRPNRAVDAA